jgi:hypothetical protein
MVKLLLQTPSDKLDRFSFISPTSIHHIRAHGFSELIAHAKKYAGGWVGCLPNLRHVCPGNGYALDLELTWECYMSMIVMLLLFA